MTDVIKKICLLVAVLGIAAFAAGCVTGTLSSLAVTLTLYAYIWKQTRVSNGTPNRHPPSVSLSIGSPVAVNRHGECVNTSTDYIGIVEPPPRGQTVPLRLNDDEPQAEPEPPRRPPGRVELLDI